MFNWKNLTKYADNFRAKQIRRQRLVNSPDYTTKFVSATLFIYKQEPMKGADILRPVDIYGAFVDLDGTLQKYSVPSTFKIFSLTDIFRSYGTL